MRLAKCCRPVPGDEIAGYVSLGRGITIHRTDCKNVKALKRAPERFVEVRWQGENEASYRVELQIDAYDRTRLLEDLSRTFSEAGINIIGASCTTNHPMVKNKFVVEVGDTEQLKQCISRLRNVESVFDAYRVTPAALGAGLCKTVERWSNWFRRDSEPYRGARPPMIVDAERRSHRSHRGDREALLAELERRDEVGEVLGMARQAVRSGSEEGWEKVAYRRGDILDRGALAALFDGVDVAVHLAFAIFGSREETRKVNLEGTRNVFETAIRAGVKRLVYASSVAAYGFHPGEPAAADRGRAGPRLGRASTTPPRRRSWRTCSTSCCWGARSRPTSSAPASSPGRGRRC